MISFTHDDEAIDEADDLELPPDVGGAGAENEPPIEGDWVNEGLGSEEDGGGLDDAASGDLSIGEELRELDTAVDDGDVRALDTGADAVDFEDRAGEEGAGLEGMPDADVEVDELPTDEDGGAEGTGEDPAAGVDEGELPPLGDDDGDGPGEAGACAHG